MREEEIILRAGIQILSSIILDCDLLGDLYARNFVNTLKFTLYHRLDELTSIP